MVKSVKDFGGGQVSVERTLIVTSAVSGVKVKAAVVEESIEVAAAMCWCQSRCTRCLEDNEAAELSSE